MKTQKEMLAEMFEMQDKLNCKIHPKWQKQNFPWHRAIWVECAELMDHYGYKWWKKQEPNIDQCKLELVDIWHFLMSFTLDHNLYDLDNIVSDIERAYDYGDIQDLKDEVEFFVIDCINGFANTYNFFWLCALIDLSFEELYKLYIGKNALNEFRNVNGYNDGTYKKIWGGREDNEHLIEILDSLNEQSPVFVAEVYDELCVRYQRECVLN